MVPLNNANHFKLVVLFIIICFVDDCSIDLQTKITTKRLPGLPICIRLNDLVCFRSPSSAK